MKDIGDPGRGLGDLLKGLGLGGPAPTGLFGAGSGTPTGGYRRREPGSAAPKRRPCSCECHGGAVQVHVNVDCCGCGRGRPPRRPPEEGEACPIPPPKDHPGLVDPPPGTLPPPPHRPSAKVPPWSEGEPSDPTKVPGWFRAKVRGMVRDGPTFGPRKDEFLPFLVMRYTAGDNGSRPLADGSVFWESPDIFIGENVEADAAPILPASPAAAARSDAPNTLYAHVWNLGKSPAYGVRVEFYWFDPSLGFSRSDANFVGAAYVDLANRFTLYPEWRTVTGPNGAYATRGCHAVVRCPATWVPTYLNGGHECLVVRAFDPIMDAVATDEFSPSDDRHIGQRNIAVARAASPAAIDLTLQLGYATAPGEATVEVELAEPASMGWLKLYRNTRAPGLHAPAAKVTAGILAPAPRGTRAIPLSAIPADQRARLLRTHERFHRGCDPLQVAFTASVDGLGRHEAQVVRIRQRVGGRTLGGYTVVLIGK